MAENTPIVSPSALSERWATPTGGRNPAKSRHPGKNGEARRDDRCYLRLSPPSRPVRGAEIDRRPINPLSVVGERGDVERGGNRIIPEVLVDPVFDFLEILVTGLIGDALERSRFDRVMHRDYNNSDIIYKAD
ncbi:hypothetical protein AKJ37_05420 [candidate division MSBL1 archaeon SCGC-AAA259I09]|uniref:Uncharacterized protein n=1 Tax=candidate division MSBL1 archaeon SCGC-AAA259I09 TaxID=1698267 RepID=A0A133UQJ1_9EURY|nr:hypothetical protein AKJ37_05420 [candidate division MSBL1 archaeon SCGC-AAA259I09]